MITSFNMMDHKKRLRTIVVEDERLPRLSLLAKLENFRYALEIVDSCDSYDTARESILRLRPDLLFLDIQLQGRDSIQLLEELRQTITLPYVIFTTAYSDRNYLMSAIKLSAEDYLLKPISNTELANAVAKILDRAAAVPTGPDERLCFKSVNSKIFVSVDEIAYFQADGNYSTMVSFTEKDLVLESLLSLEHRLPGDVFKRVDRKTLINIRKVHRIYQPQTCILRSEGGQQLELELSKKGLETLAALLA